MIEVIEGFDLYTTNTSGVAVSSVSGQPWSGLEARLQFVAGQGRGGGVGLGFSPLDTTSSAFRVFRNLAPSPSKTMGAAVRRTSFNNTTASYNNLVMGLRVPAVANYRWGINNTNNMLELFINITGGDAVVWSMPTVSGQWYYTELYWDTVSGEVLFYVDEILVYTGNTPVGVDISSIIYGSRNSAFTTRGCWFDDIYVASGKQILGDSAVSYMLPASDLLNQDFVPTSAPAWDCVNNIPGSTTVYVEGANIGDVSDFGLGLPPSPNYQVHALGLTAKTLRSGPAVEEFQPRYVVSGTGYNGQTMVAPSGTYTWQQEISQTNPATGLPWSVSDLDTLGVGIEKVS